MEEQPSCLLILAAWDQIVPFSPQPSARRAGRDGWSGQETAMSVKGTYNKNYAVEKFGFKDLGDVAYNLEAPALYEESMRRGEAMLVAGGAINAERRKSAPNIIISNWPASSAW